MTDLVDEVIALNTRDRVVVYPSVFARPVPSFVLSKPDDWIVTELPQTVMAVGTPEPVDGVWVNASVVHERVLPTMTIEIAAQASWGQVKRAYAHAEIGDEKMMTFGELEVYMRGTDLPATQDGPPLAQVTAIFFGPERDRPTVDLFQIVCTAPHAKMPELLPTFVAIIGSFTFL